jgi:hypothetical protein
MARVIATEVVENPEGALVGVRDSERGHYLTRTPTHKGWYVWVTLSNGTRYLVGASKLNVGHAGESISVGFDTREEAETEADRIRAND